MNQEARYLHQIIDYIPMPAFWKDKDLVVRGCNPAFLAMTGIENKQEIVGKRDIDLP